MKTIRISKEMKEVRKMDRLARTIKAEGYAKAIEERPKRYYINQNKGVTL